MAAQKAAHHCVFFYDVLSPYSYLAFEVLMRYKKVWNMSVELKPFHLGAIMKESGNRPPGLVPAKKLHMDVDLKRMAAYYNVKLTLPENIAEVLFSKGSTAAQRVLVAASLSSPAHVEPLTRMFWRRIYEFHKDITEPQSLRDACVDAGVPAGQVDALLKMSTTDQVKDTLRSNTADAIARGAFGAPTFYVDGEMYFGSDRFMLVARQLGLPWYGPEPGNKYATDLQEIVSGKAKL